MELTSVYPGLHAERFLREVTDVLRQPPDSSVHALSQAELRHLEDEFRSGVPFPYMLKESEFFHHRFYVNEHVLIPRPETEYLVDMIVRGRRRFHHILDVGTGSGVILLSLVKSGVAGKGTGSDISSEALKVAAINQRRLRLKDRTSLVLSDRLQKIGGTFDLVVSNPPYIRATSQRSLVQESVDRYEPHSALYLPDDEYDRWFTDFFCEVLGHLSPGGEFWMEGHEQEVRNQAAQLLSCGFSSAQVIEDLAGSPRFLKAER